MGKDYSPQELYRILSTSVIGQEDYLQKIAITVWLHNKRIEAFEQSKYVSNKPHFQKYNLLCVGPTGSGKTLALQKLAKLYGIDLLVYDASGLTGAGWKGNDADDVIKKLFFECNKDVKRCEKAIVVLDEYDKALYGKDYHDRSFSIENTLLKIIEGDTVDIEVKSSNYEKTYSIDTKNILFIVAGAFEGIEDIVRNRICKKNLGFGGGLPEPYSDSELFQMITKADLCAYGMGRQFLGRFSDIAVLNELGVPELTKILLESDTSPITSLSYTLQNTCGISVGITSDGADAIARMAVEEGTGARGLAQIIIPVITDTLFIMEGEKDVNQIQIIEMPDGEPGIKLIEGERYTSHSFKYYDYREQKVMPYRFPKSRRKNVEHFVDYIMFPGLHKEGDIPLRDVKAIRALFCSIVFYLLERFQSDCWKLENIGVVLRNHDACRSYTHTINELSHDGTLECVNYYNIYRRLSCSSFAITAALRLYNTFMEHPYFGQNL